MANVSTNDRYIGTKFKIKKILKTVNFCSKKPGRRTETSSSHIYHLDLYDKAAFYKFSFAFIIFDNEGLGSFSNSRYFTFI